MKVDKYAGDYRLKNIETKNKRLKTVRYYVGDTYRYKQSNMISKTRKRYLIYTFFIISSLIASMFIAVSALRVWFVMIPFYINLIPLIYLIEGVYTLLSAKEPLKREQNDKLHTRFGAVCFVMIFLSSVSLVGSVAAIIKGVNPLSFGDALFVGCILLCLSFCVLSFVFKEFIATEKNGNNC